MTGRDVLVATIESVPESIALHRDDFMADLHQAKGVGDDLILRGVMAFLDYSWRMWAGSRSQNAEPAN